MPAQDGLTVAVTGPTGDLGVSIVEALERSSKVSRVVGLARRPFDPAERGWTKTEYMRGDVQDRATVRAAIEGAAVVVHLAFSILGTGREEETRAINVDGSRIVFEEAVDTGVARLCYASSVAAYGFHRENPDWLTEDVPARGSPELFYSCQKAEVERLLGEVLEGGRTAAYVFRPCVVAGPTALTLLEQIPYLQLSDRLPDSVLRLLELVPLVKPVIPDPGVRFQLVHADDVAQAFLAGVLGKGSPGAYNLAASGTLTARDLANALGWYTIPIAKLTVDVVAELFERIPFAGERAAWLNALRKPVLMRTARAKKELGWRPEHTSKETLRLTVEAWRDREADLVA